MSCQTIYHAIDSLALSDKSTLKLVTELCNDFEVQQIERWTVSNFDMSGRDCR